MNNCKAESIPRIIACGSNGNTTTYHENKSPCTNKLGTAFVIWAAIGVSGVLLTGGMYMPSNSMIVPFVEPSEHESGISRLNITSGGIVEMPFEYHKNNEILDQIASLKNNWNDNGAEAFSKEIIQRSRDLITTLDRQPMIFPTANDSIQFEYEKENGDYLEFELFENGKCKLFHQSPDEKYDRRFIDPENMNAEVNRFYGQQLQK